MAHLEKYCEHHCSNNSGLQYMIHAGHCMVFIVIKARFL